MSPCRIAAILKTDSLSNHLDHLMPLCDLFHASLLVPEGSLEEMAKTFYPPIDVKWVDHWDLEPLALREKYDLVIHSFFWREGLLSLLNDEGKKPFRTLYTPHGNSDKGHHSILMERFADQDITLLYGNHMKDFLKHKMALDKIKYPITMGNIRYRYYLRHKQFFDQIVEEKVFSKFFSKKPVALYAPTWNDEENSSSFFHALDLVCSQLPSSYNLIVKIHPYLYFHLPGEVLSLMGRYEKEGSVLFMVDFPLIYPLLAKTDLYIGDFSSVGYDFLTFDRPMVFFDLTSRKKEDKSRFLHQCGVVIDNLENVDLLAQIQNGLLLEKEYQKKRKKLYKYTFSIVQDQELKKEVLSSLNHE